MALRVVDRLAQREASWRELDALLGRRVSWSGGSSIGAGIDDDGRLLVETPSGRRGLDAGEVHLLG